MTTPAPQVFATLARLSCGKELACLVRVKTALLHSLPPHLHLPAPLTVLTTTKAGNMRQLVAAGRKAKAPSRSCCKSRTSEHSIPAIRRAPPSFSAYPSPSRGAYAAAPVLQSMSTFVLAAGAPAPAAAPYPTPSAVAASVLGPVPFPHLSSDSPRTFVHMHFYCSCHKCRGRGGAGSEVGERSGERTKNVAETNIAKSQKQSSAAAASHPAPVCLSTSFFAALFSSALASSACNSCGALLANVVVVVAVVIAATK